MPNILRDDILFALRALPDLMLFTTTTYYVNIFVILFFSGTAVACGYVLLSNINFEFWHKYSLLSFGSALSFSYYAIALLKRNEYTRIRAEIFPKFWPLTSMGDVEYQEIRKFSRRVKVFIVLTIVSTFAASSAGLPWYGDEYDIMLPVKVYSDYLGKLSFPILIIFYLSMYHAGLTTMSITFILIHLILHIRFQYFLLNKRLSCLLKTPVRLGYQNHVERKLKLCIHHHQQLLQIARRLNVFIYYPLFLVTTSSILFSVSIFFYMKDFNNSLLRGTTLSVTGILITAGFCINGQLLENESGMLYDTAANLPWYLWNKTNRQTLLILLSKSRTPLVLSFSGIITINHTLFISLYTKITSVLSFFMNI